MKPIDCGKDEWWCEWYRCTACQTESTDMFESNAHIARIFKYCPECGVEIDWSYEEVREAACRNKSES